MDDHKGMHWSESKKAWVAYAAMNGHHLTAAYNKLARLDGEMTDAQRSERMGAIAAELKSRGATLTDEGWRWPEVPVAGADEFRGDATK